MEVEKGMVNECCAGQQLRDGCIYFFQVEKRGRGRLSSKTEEGVDKTSER